MADPAGGLKSPGPPAHRSARAPTGAPGVAENLERRALSAAAMKPPARLLAALLSLLAPACAAHESDAALEAETPGARRAALARLLGIELPAVAGREAAGLGPSVWLGLNAFAVVHSTGSVMQLAPLAPTPIAAPVEVAGPTQFPVRARSGPKAPDPLIHGLYDALVQEMQGPGLDVFVDRRVPIELVLRVLYTASRAGWSEIRLHGGSPEQPGGLTVQAPPWCGITAPLTPPFRELRADLVVAWGEAGVLVRAEPRPADREPFAIRGLPMAPPLEHGEPEPPDPAHGLPTALPLRLAGAGPQELLGPPALARLAAELCASNRGPTGVELAPLATTTYAEFLAIAVASQMPANCATVPRLDHAPEPAPPAATAVAIDRWQAHALARATP